MFFLLYSQFSNSKPQVFWTEVCIIKRYIIIIFNKINILLYPRLSFEGVFLNPTLIF